MCFKMSMATFDSALYKKSRDQINLEFHNSCVDHARKYRHIELTQKEKDFKRKYSWYLKDRPKNQRKTSFPTVVREKSERSLNQNVSISLKTKDSQNDNACDQKSSSSGTPVSTGLEVTSGSASTDSGPQVSRQQSCSSRRTSVAESGLPSLVASRRKSMFDVESEDRVSYLEKLWDKVFTMDTNDFTHSGQRRRLQSQQLKDKYTGIVMHQFESKAKTENTTKQLPDIKKRGSVQLPQHTRLRAGSGSRSCCSNGESELSRLDTCSKVDGEDHEPAQRRKSRNNSDTKAYYFTRKDKQADEMTKPEETVDEMTKPEETVDEMTKPEKTVDGKIYSEKTVPEAENKTRTKQAPLKRSRSWSLHVPLIKPPFQMYSKSRSSSVDLEVSSNMWRASNFNLLASRRSGRDRLMKCVRLAMSKDKIANLKGKKWRDDIKRCRYLRIPEDSPYFSPINSESDSDF